MKYHVTTSVIICIIAATMTSSCSQKIALGGAPGLLAVSSGALPTPTINSSFAYAQRYTVGPYDKIAVSVLGLPELSVKETIVDANGAIAVPLAGSINVVGLTPEQISTKIAYSLSRSYLRDPQVTVTLLEAVSHAVTIDGQVKRPGLYPIGNSTTLLRTIALAEGLTERAKLKEVVVFRTVDERRYAALYDLGAIRQGRYEDPEIFAGDIVLVNDDQARLLFKDILTSLPAILTPIVILLTQ